MIDVPLRAATALVFVRLHLVATSDACRVPSRFVSEQCADWCVALRLPVPSVRDITRAMRSMGYAHGKSNGQRVWRGAGWREPDPWNALAAPDMLRRLATTAPVLTLAEFCELTGTARSTYYALRARGEAPTTHRRGNRLFIAATDAVNWCAARGRHAAVLAVVEWAEAQRASVTRVVNRAGCVGQRSRHQGTRTLDPDMAWTNGAA